MPVMAGAFPKNRKRKNTQKGAFDSKALGRMAEKRWYDEVVEDIRALNIRR